MIFLALNINKVRRPLAFVRQALFHGICGSLSSEAGRR